MDAGIGRSNDQRICIGLEPSWEIFHGAQAHIGSGAYSILIVAANEKNDTMPQLFMMLEELTRRTFGDVAL